MEIDIDQIFIPQNFNSLVPYPVSSGGYEFGYLPKDLKVRVVKLEKSEHYDNIVVRNGNSPTTFAYSREEFLDFYEPFMGYYNG